MNITEWTTALRYRPYHLWDKEYTKTLEEQVQQSTWRLDFHIQPKSGLLNDPNGFSYFNGQWHLFYQAFPYGPVHGLKSWFHLTSDNLVDWQAEGVKLEPSALAGVDGLRLSASGAFGPVVAATGATHILWATGGSLVPPVEWEKYDERGATLSKEREGQEKRICE